MSGDDLLLLQAGAVLVLMAVLALLKRRVRRTGLNRYVAYWSKPRSRLVPVARAEAPQAAEDSEA